MTTRKLPRTVSTSFAVLLALLLFPAASSSIERRVEADEMAPDLPEPLKGYALAGQSNMLAVGNVNGGNIRISARQPTQAPPGAWLAAYQGKYDAAADYNRRTPIPTRTVIYDGMGNDLFPKVDGEANYVARRPRLFRRLRDLYLQYPGAGGPRSLSKGAWQRPGAHSGNADRPQAISLQSLLSEEGRQHVFWVGRTDIPGTRNPVVKQQGNFPYMLGEDGQWIERDDVFFRDARPYGG